MWHFWQPPNGDLTEKQAPLRFFARYSLALPLSTVSIAAHKAQSAYDPTKNSQMKAVQPNQHVIIPLSHPAKQPCLMTCVDRVGQRTIRPQRA
jgi:hypothetical protein